MQSDHGLERIAQFKPNEWQNLQQNIDLVDGNVSGDIGTTLNHTSFSGKPLISQWTGTLDLVVFESSNGEQVAAPAIDFDNLDVREEIIPSAFTPITYPSSASWELDRATLSKELMELVAMEGNFDLQEPNTGLLSPWNAGPNSVVKVANRSQSPPCGLKDYDDIQSTLRPITPRCLAIHDWRLEAFAWNVSQLLAEDMPSKARQEPRLPVRISNYRVPSS